MSPDEDAAAAIATKAEEARVSDVRIRRARVIVTEMDCCRGSAGRTIPQIRGAQKKILVGAYCSWPDTIGDGGKGSFAQKPGGRGVRNYLRRATRLSCGLRA